MELLVKHYYALWNLAFGAAFAVAAVLILVKHRSVFGVILLVSVGAVFSSVGLLALRGLIAPEWVTVSWFPGALFIVSVIKRVFALGARPSPGFPMWIKWAYLVFGVGILLSALVVGFYSHWH